MINKRAITQMRAWFLIVNVLVGIVAFGWVVSATIPTSMIPTKSSFNDGDLFMKIIVPCIFVLAVKLP